MTKDGIPTGVISIPQQYAHSPVEVMDVCDIELTIDLLEAAVRALPQIAGKTFLDSLQMQLHKKKRLRHCA